MLQQKGILALLLPCQCARGVLKTRSESGWLLLAGITASFVCSGLIELSSRAGVVGAKPLIELLLALVLLRRYPESCAIRWSGRLIVILCAGGAALALAWIPLFALGNTRFFDPGHASTIALVVGLASSVVAAPLYEEKVVRHLILRGVTGYIGPYWASLLISLAFGLIHTGAMLWTFLVSLVLCWCALAKGLGSTQRALIHGVMNAMIMLWYFTAGYGLFR